jgi:AraC family transcriptional regulator of adaptative response/methylated-DNA-[protein]-cysteine methyltransferase
MSAPDTLADARWAAVVARDAASDRAFVYAVTSTGVFCRPSCASRRPLRRNVEFFETPAEAERAGYRACRRCGPGAPDRAERTARIVRACRLLEGEAPVTTRALARRLGVDVFHLQRQFRREVGVTPQAYRRRVLAERARAALQLAPSVSAAVYEAGYSSSSRFYEGVGRELGMAPRRARAGEGPEVRFALRRCSLGAIGIAWTDRGVCDVRFAASGDEAARAIQARWPAARREPSGTPPWVDRVVEAVERPGPSDIPLDIRGTAFQQRVWAALRRIPPGETRSYAELAAALGLRGAARAVGRACAQNPIAVLVPCHRVVRGDGALAGYRWGVERKRALLRRERGR